MAVAASISLTINKVVMESIRGQWAMVTGLMISFLLGYTAYLFFQFHSMENFLELITGTVFLGGALFVLLVMGLIQNTLILMNNASQSLKDKIIEHKLVSEELEKSRASLEGVFNSAMPLCITSNDFEIIQANEAYYDIFGRPELMSGRQKCFESRPNDNCHTDMCPLARIRNGENDVVSDTKRQDRNRQEMTFIVTARPFLNSQKEKIGIVESFQDITKRKRAEDAKEELIIGLQKAQEEVNLLSGLLPICASCKNIRDDKGYWKKIESYISDHAKVEFSHAICPDCAQKLYPEFYKEIT